MKKHVVALTAVASLILFGAPLSVASSATAPKAGTTCSPKGKTVTVGNKKYTCVASGKKLVWNSGVTVSTTTTTVPPTTTTTVPVAAIPVTLPVAQNGTITFANIQDHISEISAAAYNAIQATYSSNKAVTNIPITIHVGPNSKRSDGNPDPKATVLKMMQLWNGFKQPTSVDLVYSGASDVDWGVSTLASVPGACGGFTADLLKTGGANMGMCKSGAAIGRFYVQPTTNAMTNYLIYAVEGHEYTHSAQQAQFIGSSVCFQIDAAHLQCNDPSSAYQGVTPCWWNEGQANALGIGLGATSSALYSSIRSEEMRGGSGLSDTSATGIQNFLTSQVPFACRNDSTFSYNYSIGALTLEALIAIGGPQSTMALIYREAQGDTFAQAFEKVYGISWASGAAILAKVVASEYATLNGR